MKVVFDSNIFVSALVKPEGRAEEALLNIIDGHDLLLISKEIILETVRVLAKKFSREKEELARVAVYLAELGELVEPKQRLKILADEPDNRILECAVKGHADGIVTGDREMLALHRYKSIPIMSLKQFLALPR